MKDPFVSRRSKVLAFQAEERFGKEHLERKPEREHMEVLEGGLYPTASFLP